MLLYITVMLKPLLPIASDWWSHEFNEIEHISEVHAIYGSHHLQKEVADTSTENDHKDQNSSKSEDSFPFHVLPETGSYNFAITKSDNKYSPYLFDKLPLVDISNPGPPPDFFL